MRVKIVAWIASISLSCLGALAQEVPDSLSDLAVQAPGVARSAMRLGHSDPNRVLHVSVSLPLADEAGLQSYVDSISDPKGPNYRKFLTPEDVGVQFGLPQNKVDAVKNYLIANGFGIRLVGKNRMSILADCTVAQAEAAFHTTISDFQTSDPKAPGNHSFYCFTSPLRVPSSIAPSILDVAGLESFTKPKARSTLSPTQTRHLYSLATMYGAGNHGEGRTIAISNWDGYRLTNVPLYYSQYGLPTPPGGVGSNITVVTISGGAGGGTAQGEGDLDIQMILGMAPLCNFRIYDGGNSDLIGVLTREANDNLADVISESWGWSLGSTTATAAHNLHLSMNAQGITYMAASGDSGTSIEPYSYPDYDPEVLLVGGTSATVDGSGNRTAEVGWNSGGGGWSNNTATFNVLPSWQHGTGVPSNINHRLVPDLAFHASGTQTSGAGAYYFYNNGALTGGYLGTSFACPVFAGMLGTTEQKIIGLGGLAADGLGHQRFGRIQDLLYSQNMRSDIWLDITSGANGTLPNGSTSTAGAGWDFVTGLGVMNMDAFAASQAGSNGDFTVNATPSSQNVGRGYGTSFTVSTAALNNFSGTVGFTVTGLPTGATATFTPSSLAAGGSTTLGISTASNTTTGTFTLTIKATSGNLVHTTTVTLTVSVPNFTIAAAPSGQTVQQGSSATYTVTTTAVNSFSGAIALSVTGLPTGAAATFNPTSINSSGSSTLTVTTTSGTTPAGAYTLTIKGISGQLNHTTTVTLTVNVPDFSIAVSPSSQSVIRPAAATYTVTTTALNSFSGSIALTVTGLPTGTTATFNPTSITGSGTSTLTVTPGANTPAGTYTLTVKGTSGSLSHTSTATFVVTIPDFTISATPSTQNVIQGNSVNYTVTTTAQNTFSGTVALTATGLPTGATATFSPTSISGAGTSTLTISTGPTTPGGTYTITIKGTSSPLSHTTTVKVVVSVPDFTIAAAPASQTVIQGNSATYTVTTTSVNTFAGTVALTATGLPTGATATFNPTSISGAGSSTLTVTTASNTPGGTFTITIKGTSGNLIHTTSVKLVVNVPNFTIAASPASQTVIQGNGANYTVTTTSTYGFAGTINLSASGLPAGVAASFSPTSVTGAGTSTLTLTTGPTTPGGTFTVTVIGTSGSLTHSTTIKLVVNVPNFTIAAAPASQTVIQGNSTTYTVTTTSTYTFAGVVGLSVSGLPAGAGASFSPATITGAGSSTLTVTTSSSTPGGTYTITITGTSGSLVHSTTVRMTVNVPNFTLVATPSTQSVVQGSGTRFTISTTAINSFSGVVNLSVTGLPTGVVGNFTPATITGAGSSFFDISTDVSTPYTTYTLTITGTCGSIAHSTTVKLVVISIIPPDFSLSMSASNLVVNRGNSTSCQVFATPTYGFSGSVTATVTGQPRGMSATCSPSTFKGSTTLIVAASSSTAPGTYTLTITGKYGTTIVHTATVTVTVQ
ncbi:MAG TPA: protease pro-enzyme activation domain-containing protein [Fimbriimonadaceae bacterium]|nr:protease pro-enzyme activation domain-containing protein [Fimbriimonadaceae bacterium]